MCASAIRCGTALARAQRVVGHGNWQKYLADYHPDISYETARRWIKVASKMSGVTDLENVGGITALYRQLGMAGEKQSDGTGTDVIDISEIFSNKIEKRCNSVLALASEFDLASITPDRRGKIHHAAWLAIGKLQTIYEASA